MEKASAIQRTQIIQIDRNAVASPTTLGDLQYSRQKKIYLSMRYPVRQIFASILIMFMLNTLSWSVSTVAFADWVASEHASVQSNDTNSTAPESGYPDKGGKHCNEGCHIFSHLQGLVHAVPVYHLPLDSFVRPGSLRIPGGRSPDGLFRPPRSSVLA